MEASELLSGGAYAPVTPPPSRFSGLNGAFRGQATLVRLCGLQSSPALAIGVHVSYPLSHRSMRSVYAPDRESIPGLCRIFNGRILVLGSQTRKIDDRGSTLPAEMIKRRLGALSSSPGIAPICGLIDCGAPAGGPCAGHVPVRDRHAEHARSVWSCDFRQGNSRLRNWSICTELVPDQIHVAVNLH